VMNERLYMNFQILSGDVDLNKLNAQLAQAKVPHVLYDEINNARIGLLTWSSDPSYFVK